MTWNVEITFVFARLKGPMRQHLREAGVLDLVREQHVYPTVRAAVAAAPRQRGATMSMPPYEEPGRTRPRATIDAGRLWIGGVATAAVAALLAVVGVLIARGLFDIPLLAPTGEGTLGDASTARLAGLAAGAALLATGLMHLLLVSTPRPGQFFTWIVVLLTAIAVILPFLTDAEQDTQIATAALNLCIGAAIGSLVSSVARSAVRVGNA